ncbi:MAG: hypothetical protein JXR81_08855 [Candidatus Goldbacteria bacterium]|nr:hypothetical protein [Candidatus Goldiibacteriota bacterium]
MTDIDGYISSLNEFKFDYSLGRIKAILSSLDNPQDAFGVIHIAGSNGKGSTAAFIEAIFRASEFKTGLYTSPHINNFRERIAVNGKTAPENVLLKNVNLLKKTVKKNSTYLTYFEFMTVLAFLVFRECGVELAVIEAGLGGRYDATNVNYAAKLLSVITSVSLEHTQLLGNTKIKILKEKEAIVKGAGLFNLKGNNLRKHVKKRFGEMAFFPEDYFKVENTKHNNSGLTAALRDVKNKHSLKLKLSMHEDVMAQNAAIALAAADIIKSMDVNIDMKKAVKALERVKVSGRLQKISKDTFVSVAHNPEAADSVFGALAKMSAGKVTYIFSALKDKDIKSILRSIKKYRDVQLVITSIDNERAESPAVIKKLADKAGFKSYLEPDNKKALALARKIKGRGVIVIGGSFYLAGKFLIKIVR